MRGDLILMIFGILAVFTCGFVCGQISGCTRGGCWWHGRDYKVKP